MRMIKGAYFILKDKQFYRDKRGYLNYEGNPIKIAKKLKKDGYELIHIRDEDLLNRSIKNLDVLDKLTYFIHTEIEINEKAIQFIKKLKSMKIRIIISLSEIIKINEKLYKNIDGILINKKEEVNIFKTSHSIMKKLRKQDIIIKEPYIKELNDIIKNYRIFELGDCNKLLKTSFACIKE